MVADLSKDDRAHRYQYDKVHLKMEKVGILQWYYGELTIRKLVLTKTTNFMSISIELSSQIGYAWV